MIFIIAMVLIGAVNQIMCDPDLPPNYSANCEPPTGMPLTTASPDNTSVTPYGLYPIERCCPACEECIHIGGHCKLRWIPELYPQFCDFTTINECRDYSCTCCIKCADDKCSDCTQTGGECRVECRTDEQEDKNNRCSYSLSNYDGCKCCKKCEATSECTDALGKCVTDPAKCPYGTFASTGCCGGCYCCKPVLTGFPDPENPGQLTCSNDGAYCTETDDCAAGYYPCFGQCEATQFVNGLQQKVPGYCCEPKNTRRRSLDTIVNKMIGPLAGNNGRINHQF